MESPQQFLERQVLGLVVQHPREFGLTFREMFHADQFNGREMSLALVLGEMLDKDLDIDPVTVSQYARNNGFAARVDIADVFAATDAAQHSLWPPTTFKTLREKFLEREVFTSIARLHHMAETNSASSVLETMGTELDRLSKIGDKAEDEPDETFFDFLNRASMEIDWAIPNLLPSGTSLMVTGEEGMGKSVFLRQLAISAALGLDPFNPADRAAQYDPKRVLIIDAEVTENQMRRSLNSLYGNAYRYRDNATDLAVQNIFPKSMRGKINLMEPEDAAWLTRKVRNLRPDILVIGPVYQFAETDHNLEENVLRWRRPLDRVLSDGCAVVVEHHAGHVQKNGQRDLRATGSSAIMRWAAQGIGLRGKSCDRHGMTGCDDCTRTAIIDKWRVARDEVHWPTHLRSGGRESTWWMQDLVAEGLAA